MKKQKKIGYGLIILLIFSILYYIASILVLDGKFTIESQYDESTIPDSKENGIFVTDNLKIFIEGDTMLKYAKDLEMWTNTRHDITNYGFLFYWTFSEPQWRNLNINIKENTIFSNQQICVNDSYQKNDIFVCCNNIPCKVNDTVTVFFYKCFTNEKLGNIKVVIR